MNKVVNHKYFSSVFLVGIGGISMSAIAKFCLNLGIKVEGSDSNLNEQTEVLVKMGAKVYKGHNANNLSKCDVLVYSSAIKMDNEEIICARSLDIPVYKRSEFLQILLSAYQKCVGISGSHGKTTCTAMLSKILIMAGKDPTVFLGGEDLEYGNFRMGSGEYAVVEACEYKRSFLDIKPKVSVVLNIDNDHLDCYSDMNEMAKCFRKFVGENLAVINADDKYAPLLENYTTVTFGITNPATYMADNIKKENDGYSFNVIAYAMNYGRVKLKVKGKHNVYNALCAFATADLLGIDREICKRALGSFYGVKRRNEYLGKAFNLEWYADYAHHPKEINATLHAFLESGDDFVTIFQPHTYSRTRTLMNDFTHALLECNSLIIYKTYPAREKYDGRGSAKRLYDTMLKRSKSQDKIIYARTCNQLIDAVKSFGVNKKRVLVLGAGDIYQLACNIVQKNNQKE